ncbi:AAR2 domain protein [Penicillium brasilianum]|uniref:AAR2 domain protein n=1 Tax=Penicillium brasilianum TaxID=104259 RepID=A0A1S9RIK2_PENBI|nr:AAR2 domain protein [Penicillium brasilianum]
MPPSHQPSPTILLPQLPPKTLVGIDLVAFSSTANFHGIRDLPLGWHFLYTGSTESYSLRCGAWFYVSDISSAGQGDNETAVVVAQAQQTLAPEIYIWKWNTDTESLSLLTNDNDAGRQEAMRYKANLGALLHSGGLFRYRSRVSPAMLSNKPGSAPLDARQAEEDEENEEHGRRDWRQLTNRLSPEILSRIIGDPEVDLDGHPRWLVTSASTANRDADHIPGVDSPAVGEGGVSRKIMEQEKEFGFLPIELKRTWREGAIGRERTEAAQDKSWALGDLVFKYSSRVPGEITVDEQTGEAQVLGELQFTFLMVLTMMNFSCLQQWKRLLELILTSRRAILEREAFMSEVVRLLLRQLERCDDVEGGLFEIDGDEGGKFLRNLLTQFRRSVDEVVPKGTESMVKTELDKLEAWVKEEFDWELRRESIVRRGMLQLEDGEQIEMEIEDNDADEETGEYAPLVVDLEEHNDLSEEEQIEEDQASDLEDMRY